MNLGKMWKKSPLAMKILLALGAGTGIAATGGALLGAAAPAAGTAAGTTAAGAGGAAATAGTAATTGAALGTGAGGAGSALLSLAPTSGVVASAPPAAAASPWWATFLKGTGERGANEFLGSLFRPKDKPTPLPPQPMEQQRSDVRPTFYEEPSLAEMYRRMGGY